MNAFKSFFLVLAVLIGSIGSGSFAMASGTAFDPYAPVKSIWADLRGHNQQVREIQEVSDQEHQQFSKLAIQQARIWSDTILEGDFEAAGDTRVDLVQGIFSGDQLLAYRVTFSETAWSTAQCNYDPADKSTLQACVPGRIVESMYITPDLTGFERDERNFAHFVN